MGRISRLEHIGLGAARDKYEETIRFYERVFGWHRIKETPGELAFIGDSAGGRLEILANDAPPLAPPHHLAFAVDSADFDVVAGELRAAGVRTEEAYISDFGDRLLYFADPAGNWAQIVGRREPLAP
ncbi:MAG TPA: VOC family protein [Chloroflexota bacterium]|nr:VOC family protein [Chloroflexota bacterium]